jgi:hypothetical protein
LRDDSHYVKPEMVSKLPGTMPAPKAGPLEAVDEVLDKKLKNLDPICY